MIVCFRESSLRVIREMAGMRVTRLSSVALQYFQHILAVRARCTDGGDVRFLR